ncbi:hypothetical protein RCH09_003819 [Actimicrobium sp. GrIS 1.19]|uniref:hypothetical protein n=1 Tax=Actimicrobium sp. GrIS 1.19 TaxID=3071708 RepID=UPI002E04E333|nr:hypothetical protein [Actimicrobium sp. GrIS 1.19]
MTVPELSSLKSWHPHHTGVYWRLVRFKVDGDNPPNPCPVMRSFFACERSLGVRGPACWLNTAVGADEFLNHPTDFH